MENVLYTTGDNRPSVWSHTGDRIEAFAKRNNAEVVTLPPNEYTAWWVLFDAMVDSIEHGKPSTWLDDDIIVGKHAESTWKYGSRIMVCEPASPHRVHPRWAKVFQKQGVPNRRPYPTTGVVAWRPNQKIKRLANWFKAGLRSGKFNTSWGDQELLALAVWELDLPFHYFPTELHGTRVLRTGRPYQMFHAGGPSNKPKRLARLKRKMELVESSA